VAHKDRLSGKPFTCSNRRFHTNTCEGKPHGAGQEKGSVFDEPLLSSEGYTLWLEHVLDRAEGRKTFWLMWYDPDGSPTIPLSGVFSHDQIREMTSRLASFIEVR
jgi:hypothetical protein